MFFFICFFFFFLPYTIPKALKFGFFLVGFVRFFSTEKEVFFKFSNQILAGCLVLRPNVVDLQLSFLHLDFGVQNWP